MKAAILSFCLLITFHTWASFEAFNDKERRLPSFSLLGDGNNIDRIRPQRNSSFTSDPSSSFPETHLAISGNGFLPTSTPKIRPFDPCEFADLEKVVKIFLECWKENQIQASEDWLKFKDKDEVIIFNVFDTPVMHKEGV